eukprot:m.79122 g.79122  ORF g.79122 m.79122 type:complete len:184 (-) comp14614_c0_seq3:88-639(-)
MAAGALAPKKLGLVVAAARSSRGIGIAGGIPWRLKADMAHFKKVTSETSNPDKQNAVVMGRKTWESIPTKFRPLPGRVNIVVTRTLATPEGVHSASSFDTAVALADALPEVESIFAIGGASIYEAALASPRLDHAHVTWVQSDAECDVFFPALDDKGLYPHPLADEQEQGGTKFQFFEYTRSP